MRPSPRVPAFAAALLLLAPAARAHEAVDFDTQVKPILQRSCGGLLCHIAQRTSGVELTTYETLLGSVGDQYQKAVVVPGDPSASPLIEKIAMEKPTFGTRMPSGFDPLPADEAALITRWIAEGARKSHRIVRGDVNLDDVTDLSDAIRILLHLFQAGEAPRCAVLGDADSSGVTDLSDAIFVLNHLFLGGQAPAELTHDEEEACREASQLSFLSIYQKVFAASCAFSSCHSAATRRGGLSLSTPDEAYAELVGKPSLNEAALAAGLLRVDAGRPEKSFLMNKITLPGPGEGNRMPSNSSLSLSPDVVGAIREWILAGAPREGTIPGVPDISDEPQPPIDRIPVPPAPENGIQIHLPAFAIAPRDEREIFYYMPRPFAGLTADPVIERIDIFMSEDSHHFILYEWTGSTPPPAGVREVQSAADIINDRRFMLGAQQSFFSLAFPPEVGIRISRNASFDLNSHYLNLHGTQTIHGEVYVNFYFAAPGTVKTLVRPIFDINPFINVPPNQSRVTTAFFPMDDGGRVPAGRQYHIYALSSHMHRHGDRFSAFLVNNLQDTTPRTMVYDNPDWDDPVFKSFATPLVLTAGQGLRFECTHTYDDPPTPASPPLTFGLTSEDEMAILLGYYAVK